MGHRPPQYDLQGDAGRFRSSLGAKLTHPESVLDHLELLGTDAAPQEQRPPKAFTEGRDVFVAHGHDPAPRDRVARFVQRIGLNPIILDQQPYPGLTIIRKFEGDAAGAAAAIVLLTPDDVGDLKRWEPSTHVLGRTSIFELGYFAAQQAGVRCVRLRGQRRNPVRRHWRALRFFR